MLHEALIGLASQRGIAVGEHAQTHSLEIGSNENGCTRRLQIVGHRLRSVAVTAVIALRYERGIVVGELIPAPRGSILLRGNASCQLLQIAMKGGIAVRCGKTGFLHLFQHIDQCKEIPGNGTPPELSRVIDLGPLLRRNACPLRCRTTPGIGRKGMIEQAHLFIPKETP